jgi:hypothetical protein
MSFTMLPIGTPYPTPVVLETQSATDRQHARDEANRRHHAHAAVETPAPDDAAATTLESEAGPPLGMLIDVKA